MRIDHIGYVSADIHSAADTLSALGFSRGEVITDVARKINICFMTNGGYRIELVSPSAEGSPIEGILKKSGNGPYHICYTTQNLDDEIEKLLIEKFKKISEPAEAVAFGGRRIVFLYNRNVGLIEIVEFKL